MRSAALEQDEADLVAIHVLVKRRDPVHESGQLAEQLHADQSAADDREREQAAFALRVGLHVGALETLDDVVAEQEGVGEGLEREGVLRTGDHHAVGHGPEGQDQLVVGQFAALPGGDRWTTRRSKSMLCTVASTNRVVRKKARMGKEQWRTSRAPEQTSNNSGVMSRKLSRLTRTISTSERCRQSFSRWRAV